MGKMVEDEDIKYIFDNYKGSNRGGDKTLLQLAAEIGVSINTIQNILHLRGRYSIIRNTTLGKQLQRIYAFNDLTPKDQARINVDTKATEDTKEVKPLSLNAIKQIELAQYQTPYEQYLLALIKNKAFVPVYKFSKGLSLALIQRILLFTTKYDYLHWDRSDTELEAFQTTDNTISLEQQQKDWCQQFPDEKDIFPRIHVSRFIVRTYKNLAPEYVLMPNKKGPGEDLITGEHCSCYYGWNLSKELKQWLEEKHFIFDTPKALRPFLQNYKTSDTLQQMQQTVEPKEITEYI